MLNIFIRLSVYDKLKANPEEHPAVLTEKPFMPNKIRESMAELFFEKFNVPSMYFGLSAVFSMYALGTITGKSRTIASIVTCADTLHSRRSRD